MLGKVLCKHGVVEGEIKERAVKGRCVTCKGYERKKYAHGSKGKFKELYSPADIGIWI